MFIKHIIFLIVRVVSTIDNIWKVSRTYTIERSAKPEVSLLVRQKSPQ